MVLDSGRLVEFDSPAQLMKDNNSLFSKLVRETTRGTEPGIVERTSSAAPLISAMAAQKLATQPNL